jgi:hypothetical protein
MTTLSIGAAKKCMGCICTFYDSRWRRHSGRSSAGAWATVIIMVAMLTVPAIIRHIRKSLDGNKTSGPNTFWSKWQKNEFNWEVLSRTKL